jgi:DNA repair protein RadA/Sms
LAKVKTIFVCTSCGSTSPKWMGKCSACGEWNTLQEEVIVRDKTTAALPKSAAQLFQPAQPHLLSGIETGQTRRLITPDNEFNRVLGGGIVPGSMVLIGGQPGIGKSTLLLQLSLQLNHKVLYVSGEESEEQIKMRAERLEGSQDNCYILTETNVERILNFASELRPDCIIIDSIQTVSSGELDAVAGSISQIRECAALIQRFAKTSHIPVFIIGHITKDGNIAGPKILEHIVDAVLQFEGDRHYTYRILRTIKNRFGSTDEMGIYEMRASGLREVSNPSELLLSQKDEDLSGSAVAATMEGMRPMLIECQALVSKAVYGNPQRTATGFELRRLSMLLAVLEKRCGLPFAMNDAFLNLAGGIRVDDPGIDLAIAAALISSLDNTPIPGDTCFVGEIGLSGEIRSVSRIEQRIQEAGRLGFKHVFLSKYNTKGLGGKSFPISLHPIGKLDELISGLFR